MARTYEQGGLVLLFAWVFWVIGSIVLHELAHGWAALWEGDDTPRRLNRLTINPWVHMGPMALLVFVVMGITWGAMPVNPARFRHGRWGDFVVALAGPAMNVALALGALVALAVVDTSMAETTNFEVNLRLFLFVGGWLNLVLAAFNLLPIPPLDGSTILGSLSPRIAHFYQQPQAQLMGLMVLIVLVATDIAGLAFSGLMDVAVAIKLAVSGVLP